MIKIKNKAIVLLLLVALIFTGAFSAFFGAPIMQAADIVEARFGEKSATDKNNRLWTHELSAWQGDKLVVSQKESVGGKDAITTSATIDQPQSELVALENIDGLVASGGLARGRLTSGNTPSEKLFNDWNFDYPLNVGGLTLNSKGERKPQHAVGLNANATQARSFSVMLAATDADGYLTFAEEQGFGYFEMTAYVDLIPEKITPEFLSGAAEYLTFSTYSDLQATTGETALASSNVAVSVANSFRVKDTEYVLSDGTKKTYNTYGSTGGSVNNDVRVTKLRFINKVKLNNVKSVKVNFNSAKIMAAATALSADRAARPEAQHFMADTFSVFKHSPARNLLLSAHANSMYRSDLYGGADIAGLINYDGSSWVNDKNKGNWTQMLVNDATGVSNNPRQQVEGLVNAENAKYDNKIYSGGEALGKVTSTDPSVSEYNANGGYFMAQAIMPTNKDKAAILDFKVINAVKGVELDFVFPKDYADADILSFVSEKVKLEYTTSATAYARSDASTTNSSVTGTMPEASEFTNVALKLLKIDPLLNNDGSVARKVAKVSSGAITQDGITYLRVKTSTYKNNYYPMLLNVAAYDKYEIGEVNVTGDSSAPAGTSLQLGAYSVPNIYNSLTWEIKKLNGQVEESTTEVTVSDAGLITASSSAMGSFRVYASADLVKSPAFSLEITNPNSITSVTAKVESLNKYEARPITVSATYAPTAATFSTVSWSIVGEGGTITANDNYLNPQVATKYATLVASKGATTVKVRVEINSAQNDGVSNVKEFDVPISGVAVDVTSVTALTTSAYTNLPKIIKYSYAPEDATLASVACERVSFKIVNGGATGAAIDQFGVFTATSAGEVTYTVTIDGVESEPVALTVFAYSGGAGKSVLENRQTSGGPIADPETKSGLKFADDGFVSELSNSGHYYAFKQGMEVKPFSLIFYDENGFNGFSMLTTLLDDGVPEGVKPESEVLSGRNYGSMRNALNEKNDDNYLVFYASQDGKNYTKIPWAGKFDSFSDPMNTTPGSPKFKANETAWPVFDIMNQEPIKGNPKYLKVSMTPIKANKPYAVMPLTQVAANNDVIKPTMTLFRTPITSAETLIIDGRASVSQGSKINYTIGDARNYKNEQINWAVTLADGAPTTDVTITAGGEFTAAKMGSYKITATITDGTIVASGALNVNVVEATPSEIILADTSRLVYSNGDAYSVVAKVKDQNGDFYDPNDVTWTIKELVKSSGSASFKAVSGSGLSVDGIVQSDYFGTLTLTFKCKEIEKSQELTINKYSVLSSLSLNGALNIAHGGKLELTAVGNDQFGDKVPSLCGIKWELSGEGFTTVTSTSKNFSVDFAGKEFSGDLKLKVTAKANELDEELFSQTFDIKVDVAPKKGCGATLFDGANGAAIMLLFVMAVAALLVILKTRNAKKS